MNPAESAALVVLNPFAPRVWNRARFARLRVERDHQGLCRRSHSTVDANLVLQWNRGGAEFVSPDGDNDIVTPVNRALEIEMEVRDDCTGLHQRLLDDVLDVLDAGLFEIGRVHRVVEMAHHIQVAESNVYLLLVIELSHIPAVSAIQFPLSDAYEGTVAIAFPAARVPETMTELADREWRLVREQSRPGPLNMALDEIAAETAADGDLRTARVYSWEPSTLSLGYHQDPATIDWEFCEREGITVTRRPTGGGAIYHDAVGDISYSIVAPADELPGDLLDSYELLCQPLMDAFDRMGVEARFASEKQPAIHEPACYLRQLHPAHDVLASDGRKISGNAQYRQRDAVIQHGSITFARTTERHLGTFADPPDAEDFEARVTSVSEQAGIDRATAIDALETALEERFGTYEGEFSDEELERADERAKQKYANDAWTRGREDPMTT